MLTEVGPQARAIIVYNEDGRNLTSPDDAGLKACWDAHGSWQGATGVAVSPQWFLSALHVGKDTGRFFDLNGKSYQTIEAAAVPNTDLVLMKVDGTLPHWVELWDESCGAELKQSGVVIGRGCARGQEILLPNDAKPGWLWGESDGKLSWGRCELAEYFDTGPTLGSLLVWAWDRKQGADTGTLSAGDSGGGLFLKDAQGKWRLAGIHFDVDPSVGGKDTQYSKNASGADPFWACIQDGRGLWRGVLGEAYRPAHTLDDVAAPMWAGSSRVAPHAGLIRSIIAPGSTAASQYPPPAVIWGPHKLHALVVAGFLCIGMALRWRYNRRLRAR
jgi:hypothetical protein